MRRAALTLAGALEGVVAGLAIGLFIGLRQFSVEGQAKPGTGFAAVPGEKGQ